MSKGFVVVQKLEQSGAEVFRTARRTWVFGINYDMAKRFATREEAEAEVDSIPIPVRSGPIWVEEAS